VEVGGSVGSGLSGFKWVEVGGSVVGLKCCRG
jgi:hypothetical protein